MTLPVRLVHPDDKSTSQRILTARNQTELDKMLKLGWKVKE